MHINSQKQRRKMWIHTVWIYTSNKATRIEKVKEKLKQKKISGTQKRNKLIRFETQEAGLKLLSHHFNSSFIDINYCEGRNTSTKELERTRYSRFIKFSFLSKGSEPVAAYFSKEVCKNLIMN